MVVDCHKCGSARFDTFISDLEGAVPSHTCQDCAHSWIGDGKEVDKDKPKEQVNHPSHYLQGRVETIDFIEDQKFGFHVGNAIKYISRAGVKTPTPEGTKQDIEKAIWYLKRYIEKEINPHIRVDDAQDN